MAKAKLNAGVCGFCTTIETVSDGETVTFNVHSDCPHITKAAKELGPMDPYVEIFKKTAQTEIYTVLSKYIPHAACPAYAAFIKSLEVAGGLALPRDFNFTWEG